MNSTILTVFSLSISGSILALMLLVLRRLLKGRTSQMFHYYIWLLVLIRLIVPISFNSSAMGWLFAELPMQIHNTSASNDVVGDTPDQEIILPQSNSESVPRENKPSKTTLESESPSSSVQNQNRRITIKPKDFVRLISKYQIAIWLLGSVAYLGWFIFAYLHFSRSIAKTSSCPHPSDIEVFKQLGGNAGIQLICNRYIDTPMLIGFFSPCIVIPQQAFVQNGMEKELRYILLHELTHFRRRDLLYKWFTVLVSSLHWFNPLMILMRREINRACELACDEAVIRSLNTSERQAYGDTLLTIAAGKRLPIGLVTSTMCENKQELKERLVSIMNYKKKTTWMVALSLILTVLLGECSMVLGAVNINNGVQSDITIQSPATSDTPANAAELSESSVSAEDYNDLADASFDNNGWNAVDGGMLSGEQNQTLEKNQVISSELPSVHRKGFQPPELTFIFDSISPASDMRDPDKEYNYDDGQNQILMPTLRESATAALQQLYDMTGYQVQKCYVLSTGDILFFSMDKDNFNHESFFYYFMNPVLITDEGVIYPWQVTILYKNEDVDSPIDATNIIKPEKLSSMSNEEIAKWYYENSTFGDRRKVIRTEPDHLGFIRLYLENGDFYEAILDNARVIQYLSGPYKKGFEH
ncbi:M56 family metallopeptidase [Anaerocolumna sp.]|uniref:M56 family metallopeptidase n=1 Tax=Anaerocolumna sp. TaxID=2041569 RepID=UPI0028B15B85|nr:M56 family metallopeptidase [Anaerocolumna sp.]